MQGPSVIFIVIFFFIWNSLLWFNSKFVLTHFPEEYPREILFFIPFYAIGIGPPIFFALSWGLIGVITLIVSVVVPYSIGILLECLTCCRQENCSIPQLPMRRARLCMPERRTRNATDSGPNVQEERNTGNVGNHGRNVGNSPTLASNPPSRSDGGSGTITVADEADLSYMNNTERREYLKKNLCSEEFSEQFCSICFEEYQAGEDISTSMDPECNHVFHKRCIMEWLVEHEHCPICRRFFVVSSSA